jgi:hypothetical protein
MIEEASKPIPVRSRREEWDINRHSTTIWKSNTLVRLKKPHPQDILVDLKTVRDGLCEIPFLNLMLFEELKAISTAHLEFGEEELIAPFSDDITQDQSPPF